ncbi:glutaredoxin family protein [Aestuariicoccus sp. MJ-SS9]|uniref:glutaredoxin family protein n=1 Tax=Aestuariicoccus sp. MJ-SS9 TaxID=3079855 RepID=UPI00291171D1|nr:glutaredoxin family protein [Aestuariicoccus sp. MJ-SS9]MDU8912260.1 glutaredoxin family protein [Aestuariicoccus sp. MJ-SS9]
MNPQTRNTGDVVIYTTPTCPDCRQLKSWLQQAGVAFEERDLSDPKIMVEAKVRYGVRVAPITVIGDWFTYGTFADQKPRVENALQEEELL